MNLEVFFLKSRVFKGSYLCYVLLFFGTYFAMSAFSSVLSVYLVGIGKSATEMSFIVSASGIFSFLILPVTGYLCDRTGRPRLISSILLVLLGIFAILFGTTKTVWALFILDGLIMSFVSSVMPVSERLAGACRFRYGTLRVWGTLGYAAGAQVAGVIIGNFPPMALFGSVAGFAVLAVLGFAGAENPEDNTDSSSSKSRAPLKSFLEHPHFLLYLLIAFLFYAAYGVNMNYAPLLLEEMGVSTNAIGTVLFVGTLTEIPIILFSNRFMDRFSGKNLLLADFGMSILQYLIYSFVKSPVIVVAAVVLLRASAGSLFMMLILKIVSNLVSFDLRTTGISVVNSATNLGMVVMQNISGFIADAAGIRTVYLVLMGIALLGSILTLFLKVDNSNKVFG